MSKISMREEARSGRRVSIERDERFKISELVLRDVRVWAPCRGCGGITLAEEANHPSRCHEGEGGGRTGKHRERATTRRAARGSRNTKY